ncbi:D-sedoheptulose 7-phosphate isomerase [Symbiobacterium terraclitae]|uniref:Phosphoheptose isomerase n=1 Tax=Symbiobacterium terraclitae TaxID=557451 RepID=A0ABS4JS94_9FIRM|nr:D-sedoheptulose 7-phosphate isomerase [Symbiobacterium terraclitae]MBP2018401.1 D-sedoheptulose 7-phosphate isomerase [Symbiobacterium terraclitae]
MSEQLRSYLAEHLSVALQMESLLPQVEDVAQVICRALEQGGRIYAFGNGGSAADAQHFTAELVGRYRRERRPLPAVALTTDPSAVTCIGNDYDFADLFARQVEGLVRPGDVVVGITTSGNSENVLRGLEAARRQGAVTVALTGGSGGRVAPVADHALVVPSGTTARIQEMHILMIHMICERIDDWALAGRQDG